MNTRLPIRTKAFAALVFLFALAHMGSTARAQTTVVTTGTGAAGAYDRTGRADVGLNVSGAFGEDQVDDGVFIGGSFSYGWTPWFALGVEGGWQDVSTSNDDLSAIPIFVDGIFRFQNHTWNAPVVPYAVVGAGAIVWDYDRDDFSVSNLDDDVDSSFAVKTGGGVDWFLNDHWALNGEIAYVFTEDDIELTSGNRSELDYWTAGGGVKYVF